MTSNYLIKLSDLFIQLLLNIQARKMQYMKRLSKFFCSHEKPGEIPKNHPILNNKEFSHHFENCVHFHEIVQTKNTERRLYVQYLGAKKRLIPSENSMESPKKSGTSTSQTKDVEITNYSNFKNVLSNEVNAVLVLLHGYQDHGSRVLPHIDPKLMCHQNGYVLVSVDAHGHGLSNGVRGHVSSMDDSATDIVQITETVKERFPNVPVVLVGGSMGGLIALHTASARRELFNGLILISPLVAQKVFTHSIFHYLAKLGTIVGLSRFGALPTLKNFYTSAKIEENFFADPLVYNGRIRVGTGHSFTQGMRNIQMTERLSVLNNLPIFAQFGSNDQLIDQRKSVEILTQKTGKKIYVKVYEGNNHMLVQDPSQNEVRQHWTYWIRETVLQRC